MENNNQYFHNENSILMKRIIHLNSIRNDIYTALLIICNKFDILAIYPECR